MEQNLSMSFVFFTFLLLPSLHLSAPVHPNTCFIDDQNALLQIKQHFGNSTLLSTWIRGTDCCRWSGVSCKKIPKTTIRRVNFLEIDSMDIVSTIPSAIGDLPFLESIFIRNSRNITGNIPPSIAKLAHLQTISFSSNNLTGPIPSFLSKLTKLSLFEVFDNRLSGPIPNFFGRLQNLNALDLSNNRLTGPIPANLGLAPKLAFLQLPNNKLSGPIPSSLGINNFEIIDLSGNKFTGDASFLFGENKSNLAHLQLGSNQLSFDLTNVVMPVGQLNSTLLVLDLSHNMIYGQIPAWVGEAPFIYQLDLSYNHLCGPIPIERGRLQAFDPSAFEHNKCLCGAPLRPCKS